MFTSENDTPSIFLNTSGRQPLKHGLALSFRMSLKAIPLRRMVAFQVGWSNCWFCSSDAVSFPGEWVFA